MHRLILSLLAISLFVPLAVAGPGHGGPTPYEQDLFVHFLDGKMVLHPSEPDGAVEEEPSGSAPGCVPSPTMHRWQAAFTREAPDYEDTPSGDIVPGLARNATFNEKIRPSLIWYVELTDLATGGASSLPFGQMSPVLRAWLRTGSDLTTFGDGDVIASAQDTSATAVAAGDRSVYVFDFRVTWEAAFLNYIPNGTDFQLEVELQVGPEQCSSSLPGLRAYSGPGLRPRVAFELYDPVFVYDIFAQWDDGTVLVDLVVTSPWGPSDIQVLGTPSLTGPQGDVRGPAGDAPGLTPASYEETERVSARWTWDQGAAPNGTYRVDLVVGSVNTGFTATDYWIFRVGADPTQVPRPAAPATPDQGIPGLAPGLALLALAAVAMRRR